MTAPYRTARTARTARFAGIALALAAALAATPAATPAFAADATTAAANFTSLMTTIAQAAAVGLFLGGLLVIGFASWLGMPRAATGGKGAMLFAVLLGVASTLLGFVQNTVAKVIG